MGWALRVFVSAFVVAGCGGSTIDRTSNGRSPPPNGGRDGGSSGGGDSGGGAREAGTDADAAPPDPADYLRPRSGSRLTVIEPYAPDQPMLWDQEKGIQCRPQLATDGTMRCLPNFGNGVSFSDSACKHPVINPVIDTCAGAAKYYIDGDFSGQCGSGNVSVYTAGARIDTPQALYPHNAYPCSLLDRSQPGDPSGNYYEAVPVDSTEWVSFKEEVLTITDELAVTVWVGADGSRLPHGFELLPSKKRCEPTPSLQDPPAPRTWCIPKVRARFGDGFPTDQCTGDHLAGACEPTDVIDDYPYDTEGIFETGERVTTVYFTNPNENGKCMTLPPGFTSAPNTSVFYRKGPPLTLDHYPTLSQTRQGSGRVQIDYLTSAGKNLRVESYFDTKYGQACTPTELSSGGTWCVPGAYQMTSGNLYSFYADPACTRGLVDVGGPGRNPYLFALVYSAGHQCTAWATPTLHSVTEYRGPIFQNSAGQCAPMDPPTLPPLPISQLYLEPGQPIDPSGVLATVPE